MRTVFDNTRDAVWLKDRDGRMLFANRVAAAYGNTGRPEELVGKTAFDTLPHSVAAEVRAHEQAVMATDSALKFELPVPAPSGPRRLLVHYFPYHDRHGALAGTGGIATDITERMRLDAESGSRRRAMREAAEGIAVVRAATASSSRPTSATPRCSGTSRRTSTGGNRDAQRPRGRGRGRGGRGRDHRDARARRPRHLPRAQHAPRRRAVLDRGHDQPRSITPTRPVLDQRPARHHRPDRTRGAGRATSRAGSPTPSPGSPSTTSTDGPAGPSRHPAPEREIGDA